MKKKLVLASLIGLLLLTTTAAIVFFRQEKATAAPEVFQSGVSGGCYIAAPDSCKIHVDHFTLNVDDGAGEQLVEFQLRANGGILYQFKGYHVRREDCLIDMDEVAALAREHRPALITSVTRRSWRPPRPLRAPAARLLSAPRSSVAARRAVSR